MTLKRVLPSSTPIHIQHRIRGQVEEFHRGGQSADGSSDRQNAGTCQGRLPCEVGDQQSAMRQALNVGSCAMHASAKGESCKRIRSGGRTEWRATGVADHLLGTGTTRGCAYIRAPRLCQRVGQALVGSKHCKRHTTSGQRGNGRFAPAAFVRAIVEEAVHWLGSRARLSSKTRWRCRAQLTGRWRRCSAADSCLPGYVRWMQAYACSRSGCRSRRCAATRTKRLLALHGVGAEDAEALALILASRRR